MSVRRLCNHGTAVSSGILCPGQTCIPWEEQAHTLLVSVCTDEMRPCRAYLKHSVNPDQAELAKTNETYEDLRLHNLSVVLTCWQALTIQPHGSTRDTD